MGEWFDGKVQTVSLSERMGAQVAELEARVATLTEERDALAARLTPEPKRSKVVCPGCKRSLADVIDSLIRQRGKFKAQRLAAEREAATLRKALVFYADEANYHMEIRNAPATGERYGAPGPIARDEGHRARAALAGAGRPTKGE